MIVGVSSRYLNDKYYLNKSYLDFLNKQNVEIKLLFLTSDFSICDSFLITGGYDLNPNYYNEINKKSKNINLINDKLDFMILDYAIKNNKPVLGICRGLQIINVYFNGTLFQDIFKNKSFYNHKKNINYHLVEFYKNDYLDLPKYFYTNSYHHQAIKKLGDNLIILARSKDNIIEAIIHKNYPIIAFQWHLELSNDVITNLIVKYLKKICFF